MQSNTVVLNDIQQQVVQELDRNIVLLASAGTGKTNTLSYRVAHILETGRATGEEILCLTFTNKACREMKERMIAIVGQEAQAVKVSTFHSFCYTILQEEAKLQEDLFKEFLIFDEEDVEELLSECLPNLVKAYSEEQGGMAPKIHANTIRQVISAVKEHRAKYQYYSSSIEDDYARTIKRMQQEQSVWYSIMSEDTAAFLAVKGMQVLMEYEWRLRSLNGLDFADLITRVHQIFQRPEVANRWRQRYSYIAVDEMQDTSELEYEVMNTMWKGNHILLCGDYFQTIYEWRGSNPITLIDRYRREYNPIELVFDTNYRSNQMLFKGAFSMLKDMFPQRVRELYRKEPKAIATQQGEPISIVAAEDAQDEARYIFQSIQQLRTGEEMPPVGILVRTNKQAIQLSEHFKRCNRSLPEEKQLKFILADELKFFRRMEIKDVLAFFKCLVNPWDVMSTKRIIRTFVKGVGDKRMEELESTAVRKTGLRITDFMSTKIFMQEPYEQLERGLAAKDIVVFDVESTGVNIMEDRIVQMAAIRIDEEGNAIDTFERFINPGVPVGDSELVHGFSDAYLQEVGGDARTVLEAFRQFADGSLIVGHNVQYDMGILEQECCRHGVAMPRVQAIYDTLDIYRRFYSNLPNHKLEFLSGHFPIDHQSTHNAMDDIIATGKLLVYAMKENILSTKAQRMAFINKYRNTFANIAATMDALRSKWTTSKPTEILTYIMKDMGVVEHYQKKVKEDPTGERRLTSIRELYLIMKELEAEHPHYVGRDGVKEILEMSALHSGEGMFRRKGDSRIPIITVHQAKGSEFEYVFIASAHDGGLPFYFAVRDGKVEEEQRIFYVALTRAKKHLTITYAKVNAKGYFQQPSRFLSSISEEYVKQVTFSRR